MKIKFFITPVYPYGNDHYYHEIIAIAEGFRELGYCIFGNVNYWWEPELNSYLIKEDNENNSFDIAIYDYRYVTSFAHLLFRKGFPNFDKTKKHVLIDRNDWISPIWIDNKNYQIFDIICAGNLYTSIKYPKNVKPWAIGLTNRIINSIDRFFSEKEEREHAIGYNFRITHNMRSLVLNGIINNVKKIPVKAFFSQEGSTEKWTESDNLYSKATTNRHFPEYFEVIARTSMFMAFGGYYEYKPIVYQPYSFIDKLKRKPYYYLAKILKNLNKDETPTLFVFQTDNFRFWEILYSGSCAINLNFKTWNIKLPIAPIDNEHYLGIHKFNTSEFANTIESYSNDKILRVGKNGRAWVKENYSPKAQANRILSYLKDL